jgi:hypothetical protein
LIPSVNADDDDDDEEEKDENKAAFDIGIFAGA